MARKARQQSETGFYHITNRGVNKANVFLDSEDHQRFIDCLRMAHEVCEYHLIAYCIMTNHFHIVIRCTSDNPIPSSLFQSVGARFSYYYHQKYRTAGQIFQGRFRSEVIESESHLLSAIRYVWNNPVEAGICAVPGAYAWSSYNLLEGESIDVDNRFLMSLMSADEWRSFVFRKNDDLHLEPFSARDDEELARWCFHRACSGRDLSSFAQLDDETLLSIVEKCRRVNISVAQIGRMTKLPVRRLRRRVRVLRHMKKYAYP